MDPVLYWNGVLLEVSRRDFTRGLPGGQQPGPIRTSRAMAIVHLAIHDALAFYRNLGPRSYLSRKGVALPPTIPPAPGPGLEADVVAGAALAALKALYDRSNTFLDGFTPPGDAAAMAYGAAIASVLLAHRDNDGWKRPLHSDPPSNPAAPGHRPDPYQPGQRQLGADWGKVLRFTMSVPGPDGETWHQTLDKYPALTSKHHQDDFLEVRDYGGAARNRRSAQQERIGVYWGYDGANGLGVPPRLYNQVARAILKGRTLNTLELADLFARLNVAMADAGIDAWHWKYDQKLWRPVVGLRLDGRPEADPFWAPYGVPRPNNSAAHYTPDFPAYPSGHATFGAALFQVLRLALATGGGPIQISDVLDVDKAKASNKAVKAVAKEAFSFVSDELDGLAVDPDGSARTRVDQPFRSFAEAVWENAISRVYLGVHWRFDGMPREEVAGQRIGGVPLGLAIGQEANLFFTGSPGSLSGLP